MRFIYIFVTFLHFNLLFFAVANEERSSKYRTLVATPIDAIIPDPRTSGTPDPTPDQIVELNSKVDEWMASHSRIEAYAYESIKVPVTFHIIQEREKSKENQAIGNEKKQIDVMNKAFAPDFEFVLVETKYHVNANWWEDSDPKGGVKSQTRVGGTDMLNVWFNRCNGGKYLGYSTLPFSANSSGDGIVSYHGSVKGGDRENYNEGKTLVHETGHWLGLYHTFHGGCSTTGDLVSDTPAEASPASGCPVGRDTCPGGGEDPIHNFMDYTYDSCMDEFTVGQRERMRALWYQYRHVPPPTTPPTKSPTNKPTHTPTNTQYTTKSPTNKPTHAPTNTQYTTKSPTKKPTQAPTNTPYTTKSPTNKPTYTPHPTKSPTFQPIPVGFCKNAPTKMIWYNKRITCLEAQEMGLCNKYQIQSHCPKTCQTCTAYNHCYDSPLNFLFSGTTYSCNEIANQDLSTRINSCNLSKKIANTCRKTCQISQCKLSPPVTRCQDSRFKFDVNGKNRYCRWIATHNPKGKCSSYPNVADSCPVTCGEPCEPYNSHDKFSLNGTKRGCNYAKKNAHIRCLNNIVRSHCPVTCKDYLFAPRLAPNQSK